MQTRPSQLKTEASVEDGRVEAAAGQEWIPGRTGVLLIRLTNTGLLVGYI